MRGTMRVIRMTALVVAFVAAAACNPPPPQAADESEPAATTAPTTAIAITTTRAAEASTTSVAESSTSTTVPVTTTSLAATTTTLSVSDLEAGLFCRDVEPLGFTYAEAVAYWIREGRPDRMDADFNGIPCETVWPAEDVLAFWGDPLPTTTTTGVHYAVGTPMYFVAPVPGADGDYYGSGCSPGGDNLPDGIWFGGIEALNGGSLVLDLMCFAPTPPGEDGFRISNTSSRLRTVPAESDARVFAVASDGGWEVVPYSTWITDPHDASFCPPDGCRLVWLYVNDERITEVVQLWFP